VKTIWKTLDEGDAFSIPLQNGSVGVGVVLIPGKEMYLGGFGPIFESITILDEGKLGNLRLVGWSMDELFYHGEWKVVGRIPTPNYPRPKHVINGPSGPMLCDFDRRPLRKAVVPGDLDVFGYRTIVSSVAFTKALNCIHGIADHEYDYGKVDAALAWYRMNQT